jgi:hypothetical protein
VIEYVDVSNFENRIDINRNTDETNCCIRVVIGGEDGKLIVHNIEIYNKVAIILDNEICII